MIKSVAVAIKRAICMMIHTVLRAFPKKIHKRYDVVVVFCSLIGDYVLWLSTKESYKSTYKGKKTLLICSDVVKDLAQLSESFTDVVSFNPKKIVDSPSYHYKMMSYFSGIESEVLISPAYTHQFAADLICAMIRSPQKICYDSKRITTIKSGLQSFLWRYSRKVIDKYFDGFFNRFITYPIDKPFSEIGAIEYFTQTVIDASFQYRLSDISFLISKYICPIKEPYVFISVSSSRAIKDWPNERVARVLSLIPSSYALVLAGRGDGDIEKANFLINRDNEEHVVYNFINKTTILEMMGLIAHSTFVMGNDTAAVHIAAAARVPSICYTHGACFGQFVPYPDYIPEKMYHPRCVYYKMDCFGCNYNCIMDFDINKPLYCLSQVSEDMVESQITQLLSELNQ